MPTKEQVAGLLARAHLQAEPHIARIVRVPGDREHEPSDPVKLLEVNPATSPSGIVPVTFSPDPPSVPFASVVVEVTEDEFARLEKGELSLPDGWSIGPTLYCAPGT